MAPRLPTPCCWHSKTGSSSLWLVLEASPTATWDHLDAFLRHTWVECCGHLSRFKHAGMAFAYGVDGASEWAWNPRSMAHRTAETLTAGIRFSDEHDSAPRPSWWVGHWSSYLARRVVLRSKCWRATSRPSTRAPRAGGARPRCALCALRWPAIRVGIATPAASTIAAATQASPTSSPSSTRLEPGSAATAGRPRDDSRSPEVPTPRHKLDRKLDRNLDRKLDDRPR